MKSLESSHPHSPTPSCGQFLVLKALMLCCCSANSPVSPISFHTKKVLNQVCKRSPYNWSLCCLALFFLAQENLVLFYCRIVEKTSFFTCSYKKEIREKNAVIAVHVSSFQFLKKQPASFFPFKILQKAARPEPQISGAFLWKYLTSLL